MKDSSNNDIEAYNFNSKRQDSLIYQATDMLKDYAKENLCLPDGYFFEKWPKLSYERIYDYLVGKGVPEDYISDFKIKSEDGNFFSIEPDGGIIVAVNKDESGNILDWVPIFSCEGKYQSDNTGNACERYFKNHNALMWLFDSEDIFPYICFCEGKGMKNRYIQGKFIIGIGNNINRIGSIRKTEIKYNNGKISYKPNGIVYFNPCDKERTADEMFGIMLSALKESVIYFFPEENK